MHIKVEICLSWPVEQWSFDVVERFPFGFQPQGVIQIRLHTFKMKHLLDFICTQVSVHVFELEHFMALACHNFELGLVSDLQFVCELKGVDDDGVVLSLFLEGRILFIHLLVDDVFGWDADV